MSWFNEYELQARGAPGFLALLPIAIVGSAVGLRSNPVVSGIVALVIAGGGPLILAGLVRARGLALEDQLFERWGGKPTTALLRLVQTSANSALRDKRRDDLTRVTGVGLLDRSDEQGDPTRADNVIDAAVASLRSKTRRDQQRFELVFAENKSYGFERNLLGLRPIGKLISVISVVVAAVLLGLAAAGEIDAKVPEMAVSFVLCAALVVMWITYPAETRVHQAADKYATALLDASSSL